MVKKVENSSNSLKIIVKTNFILKDKLNGISRETLLKAKQIYVFNKNKMTGYGKTFYISYQNLISEYDKYILVIPM